MQHLATSTDQLDDRFDHMDRDTDRAGLISNRTCDRLTDPPGGVSRELITATIFELINGLHQADVTFLNKIKELQAAVRVLFRNRNNQTQVCFDHFFFGLTGFFFALLNLLHDAAEFGDINADVLSNLSHIAAQAFNFIGRTLNQHLPTATSLFAHLFEPVRVQFTAAIRIDELTTVNPGLVSQFHHRAIDLHDAAVDAVQLVDQGFDTVVVQVE